MKKLLLPLFFFLSFFSSQAQGNGRILVHLLSYLAADYGMAVQDGEIISEAEFAEMQEFANSIYTQSSNLPDSTVSQMALLINQVDDKVSQKEIIANVSRIKKSVIKVFQLSTAPSKFPNLSRAKQNYKQLCTACHGPKGKGNGLAAAGLEPAPTNFHHPDKANGLSPFQAFNTIKLGVEGTSMIAFSDLSEEETWDLAFYVLQFSQKEQAVKNLSLSKSIGLEQLASLNNVELGELYPRLKTDKELLALARNNPEKLAKANEADYWSFAKETLKKSSDAYAAGRQAESREWALQAYLEGVEPIEMQLVAKDKSLAQALEQQLATMRALIEGQKSAAEVAVAYDASVVLLNQGEALVKGRALSAWLSFVIAFTIILREGLEAVLVIVAVLSVLKATGLAKAKPWVHGGWIMALLSGLGLWWAAQKWFVFSGAQREIMEGLIALVAVAVLLYLGFWMHSKTEAGKWQRFVNDKIGGMAKRNNLLGLAVLSFLVVFREAFESVLFLSAVSLEGGQETKAALGGGVALAFVLIALMAVLLLKFSKKLPISQLFKYSSILVAVLAFVLTGKGIYALQEAGWLQIKMLPFNLRFEWLGLYPTWQTTIGQTVILLVIILLWRKAVKPLKG